MNRNPAYAVVIYMVLGDPCARAQYLVRNLPEGGTCQVVTGFLRLFLFLLGHSDGFF